MRSLAPLIAAWLLAGCQGAQQQVDDAGQAPTAAAAAPDTKAPDREPQVKRRPRITSAGPLKLPAAAQTPSSVRARALVRGIDQFAPYVAQDPKLARVLQAFPAAVLPQLRAALPELGSTDWAALASVLDPHATSGCVLAQTPAPLVMCNLAVDPAKGERLPQVFPGLASPLAPGASATLSWENATAQLTREPAAAQGSTQQPGQRYTLTAPAPGQAQGQVQAPPEVVAYVGGPLVARERGALPGLEIDVFEAEGIEAVLPRVVAARPELAAALQALTPTALRDQLHALTLRLWLDGPRPSVEASLRWHEGGVFDQQYRAAALQALEPAALKLVPPNSIAFALGGLDLDQWAGHGLDTAWAQWLFAGLADLTQATPAQLHQASNLRLAATQGRYERLLGVVVDRRSDGAASLTVLRRLRGVSTREPWLAWVRSLAQEGGLDAWFGAGRANAVRVQLDADAGVFGEHHVDRVTLSFDEPLRASLLARGGLWATFAKGLVIERVEVAGYVVLGIDVKPRIDTTKRWVAWLSKPADKRGWIHMGSFARAPTGLGWVGGVDTTQLAKTLGSDHHVLHGALDDVRLLGATIAPSNPMMRLQTSLELVRALGEAPAAP